MKTKLTNVRAFVDQVEHMKISTADFGVVWEDFPDDHMIAMPVSIGFVNDLIKLFYSNKKRYIENN